MRRRPQPHTLRSLSLLLLAAFAARRSTMTVSRITIAALILSFSMSTAVTAQDSLWTRTYGGDWWEGANAIDATRDG